MRKLVHIDDIYTEAFGRCMSVKEMPFVECARELKDGVGIEQSLYYLWLVQNLELHGHVWKSIFKQEQALERTKKFKEIIESIGKGYSEEKHDKLRIIDGKIYGGIMATEIEGKYFLIDGTHRISAMIVNDIFEVPLLICE